MYFGKYFTQYLIFLHGVVSFKHLRIEYKPVLLVFRSEKQYRPTKIQMVQIALQLAYIGNNWNVVLGYMAWRECSFPNGEVHVA